MKLCLIYNFAAHYRQRIFTLIDQEYECDYVFGKTNADIKEMDLNLLKGKIFKLPIWEYKKKIFFQFGLPKFAFKKYDAYFILGEPRNLSSWLFLALTKIFHPKRKIYSWTHGWYGRENRFKKIANKMYDSFFDGIFLYGYYAKDIMLKNGYDEKKLFVIHNSLDYDKQLYVRNSIEPSNIYKEHFKNENKNLIFIGRLTKVKHLNLLIEAVSNLRKKGENYNVIFVGNGTEKEKLEKLVADENLQDNVWFYGACYDERENAELIYNADICVAPGNVGLTAMHTMVFGTPVLSHNDFKWQMPEFEAIRPGKTGDFFEYNNVESIESAISRWFEHNNDRENVRKACFDEIDTQWNPYFQMDVIRKNLTAT